MTMSYLSLEPSEAECWPLNVYEAYGMSNLVLDVPHTQSTLGVL